MAKKINYICSKCRGRKFVATATVTQDWQVDAHGNFISQISACNEVVASPDTDNIWSCPFCGGEGISLEEFSEIHDQEDMVFEISRDKGFHLNEEEISQMFYLAIWTSSGPAEEDGFLCLGYSIYDADKELLDGGFYEYPESKESETVADFLGDVLDFAFDEEDFIKNEIVKAGKNSSILVSDLDRWEDFDD